MKTVRFWFRNWTRATVNLNGDDYQFNVHFIDGAPVLKFWKPWNESWKPKQSVNEARRLAYWFLTRLHRSPYKYKSNIRVELDTGTRVLTVFLRMKDYRFRTSKKCAHIHVGGTRDEDYPQAAKVARTVFEALYWNKEER